MKKFDFVAELLAHGFHDDTKLEAVELSRQTGFEGVVLSRDFTKVIESVWSGRHEYSYRVEVFVNLTQNLCRAKLMVAGALLWKNCLSTLNGVRKMLRRGSRRIGTSTE